MSYILPEFSQAVARGFADWDEEQCSKCTGRLTDWGKGEEALIQEQRWCSWCLVESVHVEISSLFHSH